MKKLALLLLLPASIVGAQAIAVDEEELQRRDGEARALFDAGLRGFEEGRFESALRHFEASYALSGHVELLFNIGSSADRLRDDERAISAFRLYLNGAPNAENRVVVERRLAILERSLEPRSSSGRALPWVFVVGGGAALIAGGTLLGIALSRRSDVEGATEGRWADYEARADGVAPLSAAGIIALGVGGALAVVGVTLVLTSGDEPDDMHVTLRAEPGSLALRGTF